MSRKLSDEEYLEKRRDNEKKYKRNWVWMKLMIKKGKEMGLVVSDKEVDEELEKGKEE